MHDGTAIFANVCRYRITAYITNLKEEKRMKLSRLTAIVLFASMIVVFAGCGGAASSASGPAPASRPPSSQTDTAPSEGPADTGWKPEKPITLLVGNAAGGGADLFARQIAKIITDYKLADLIRLRLLTCPSRKATLIFWEPFQPVTIRFRFPGTRRCIRTILYRSRIFAKIPT